MAARLLALTAALALFPAAAVACPFCGGGGQTLSGEVMQADFIVLGTLANPKTDSDDHGTTEMTIQSVVKPHPYLAGKKTIILPRALRVGGPGKGGVPNSFLVFCNVYKPSADLARSAVVSSLLYADYAGATLDPYRGEEVKPGSKLPEYLKGAIAAREKDAATRLRYFFDYLDAADLVVNGDAYAEFANTEYKDVKELAAALPADRLLKWLKDPGTPGSRHGLYGLLLGHCGKPADAAALREILDQPDNAVSTGLDGMIAGYMLLDPNGGWDFLTKIVADPKREFSVRYAGLKVLRFFWESHPGTIKPEQVIDGMKAMVLQDDISDLPIEDLRKWAQWEQTDFVLRAATLPGHNRKIVSRAVLRFALCAAEQKNAAAAEYVAKAKTEDEERVKQAIEMLADERPRPVPVSTTPPQTRRK